MKRRVVDYIKLKNHLDMTINNSALVGLRRYNKMLKNILGFSVVLGVGAFLIVSKITEIDYTLTEGKKTFFKDIESNSHKESFFLKAHIKQMLEYSDNTEFDIKEDQSGISRYRHKLIRNWAQGLVLETCTNVTLIRLWIFSKCSILR